MATSQEHNYMVPGLLFVLGIFIGVLVSAIVPDKNSPVDVTTDLWAVNEDNQDEIFFRYLITNYGTQEVTDITITCKLFEDMQLIIKGTQDFGNLASESIQMGELAMPRPALSNDKEYLGVCYVESCSGCDILYKKIPGLAEVYGIQ